VADSIENVMERLSQKGATSDTVLGLFSIAFNFKEGTTSTSVLY